MGTGDNASRFIIYSDVTRHVSCSVGSVHGILFNDHCARKSAASHVIGRLEIYNELSDK